MLLECQKGQGKSLHISMSDIGNGIPIDQQQKVFEPFIRLGAESSDIPGTGIGLTVTKQLMEGMDGQVGFESTVGQGATFWIDLPIMKARAKKKSPLILLNPLY